MIKTVLTQIFALLSDVRVGWFMVGRSIGIHLKSITLIVSTSIELFFHLFFIENYTYDSIVLEHTSREAIQIFARCRIFSCFHVFEHFWNVRWGKNCCQYLRSNRKLYTLLPWPMLLTRAHSSTSAVILAICSGVRLCICPACWKSRIFIEFANFV